MRTTRPYILLITDSLAFPRREPEVVRYEETYISLLKAEFPDYDFIHVGRGGGTIVDLYKHTSYFHATVEPALVLMQCGIVDCAPRTLTVVEQQIITRLPILGTFIGAMVKRYAKHLRRWRGITYTPLSTFIEYIKRFESLYNDVYWIGILPAVPEYEAHINGIAKKINQYNDALRQYQFISTDEFVVDDIMTDFHHLNRSGHRKMFKKLADLVRAQLAGNHVCSEESSLLRAKEAQVTHNTEA
ncbi:hypothetical protein LMG19087_00577 [Ralstonia wenshanensis]|uniref:SGNH/GDSL hydrolase family protein n=1 Tax=Ralstonia wenshanensis TaxID=2842456 RepID=UPI0028F61605|nr:SGNH/GDSL hydrolase family protein [Ralstonia wenshanensis]CAJ0809861.1 hypothetical protein LMG19087_00577 [Ralstonia wenshanensis]